MLSSSTEPQPVHTASPRAASTSMSALPHAAHTRPPGILPPPPGLGPGPGSRPQAALAGTGAGRWEELGTRPRPPSRETSRLQG